jgi:hypothetical protein
MPVTKKSERVLVLMASRLMPLRSASEFQCRVAMVFYKAIAHPPEWRLFPNGGTTLRYPRLASGALACEFWQRPATPANSAAGNHS